MIWTDMPMEQAGSCRPDVFTLHKSFTRPRPTAYEIKVSISDFRSDITSGKWQKYLKYAGAVTFCVPKGLVSKSDIPAGCGLMVRGDESWRTVKAPTIQKIPDLPVNTWMKLLMSGIDQEYSMRRADREHQFSQYSAARKNFGEDVAQVILDIGGARSLIDNLKAGHKVEQDRLRIIISDQKERARLSMERDRQTLDSAVTEFKQAFGFSVTSAWSMRGEIEKIKRRCDESHEVQRLRSIIKELRAGLDAHLDGALPDLNDVKK
ncbi:MAG: MmcB family DNA repair protein [Deltaproteobacteria bacterium]|nr:MmcB family DNA repair protein [Deltaproteobacteria bacterium]